MWIHFAHTLGAGTWSRFAAFRPEMGVLAPSSCHRAICPLHQCQFPFLSLSMKRSDTCEASCRYSFVSIDQIKKPSHPFQRYNHAASPFAKKRGWLQGIFLLSTTVLVHRSDFISEREREVLFPPKNCPASGDRSHERHELSQKQKLLVTSADDHTSI